MWAVKVLLWMLGKRSPPVTKVKVSKNDPSRRRVLTMLLVVALAGYMLCVCANIVTWKNVSLYSDHGASPPESNRQETQKNAGRSRLADVSHLFTDWSDTWVNRESAVFVGDVVLVGCFLGSIVTLAVHSFKMGNLVLMARVCWIETCCMIGKALCQLVTILPDATGLEQAVCRQAEFAQPGSWILTRIHYQFCGDMIWSGHVAQALLLHYIIYCLAQQHMNHMPKWISVCCVALEISMILIMWVTHTHYSVDMILSVLFMVGALTHDRFLRFGEHLFLSPE